MGRRSWFPLNIVQRRTFAMTRYVMNLCLLIANLIGIFFYLRNASMAWVIPEEKGLDPAIAGPAMVWGLGALPLVLAFLLVDFGWWYVLSSRGRSKAIVLLASLCWAIAIAIDFYHH
jgi:hypothetical protein